MKDKTWKDAPGSGGRELYPMNYIRPILRSRAQRILSPELSWRVVPGSNAHEERDRAAVGTQVLQARWAGEDMDGRMHAAVFLADCCGISFLKKFWNPAIGPLTPATVQMPHPVTGEWLTYPVDRAGQPLMDDQGNPLEGSELGFTYRPGDTDTALRSIFNVRLNPDAHGLSLNEGFRWLVDCEVLPISVVREQWGERAAKVQTVPGVATMRTYERIVRSITGRPGTGLGNDVLTGRDGAKIPDKDTTVLYEYWEAPSGGLPGRLIVVAGDELLYPLDPSEEGLPQNVVPYVGVYSERRPYDAYGRPVVDDLIAPQRVINSQWAAIVAEQKHTGVGQWVGFDIPGLFDQITNADLAHIRIPTQSGAVMRSITDLLQRVPAPNAPADRWRLIDAAKAVMFDLGAFHEIQRGQVPPGVDSGVAVQLLQEAENGQLHPSVRGIKAALIAWGRLTLKYARWGYGENETRWLPAGRPDLAFLVESVTGVDLPDPDTCSIELEGFRPHSQAAYNAEIKEAMTQGWLDPPTGLRLMDLGRGVQGAFESQTRHYGRARGENLAIQREEFVIVPPPPETPQAALGVLGAFVHPDGSPFLLPQDDDHLVHISVHQELALDDTRPYEERTAALLHIAEHRAMLQQVLTAAPPAPTGAEDGQSPPSPRPGTSDA